MITTVFSFNCSHVQKKYKHLRGNHQMSLKLFLFVSRLLWEIFIFTKISFPIPTNDMALSADF